LGWELVEETHTYYSLDLYDNVTILQLRAWFVE
jgi:hypothetical protein